MSINEAVRYQDPEVPLNEVAAARADSYSAQTTLYATHKRILALEQLVLDLAARVAELEEASEEEEEEDEG